MPIIPLEKEIKVWELLHASNLSRRQIAKLVGISDKTVKRVEEAPSLGPRSPPRRKKRLQRCKQCGELLKFSPCVNCNPEMYYYPELPTTKVVIELLPNEMQSSFELIRDLIEFAKLNVIPYPFDMNPLFVDLIKRAKEVLNGLLEKKKTTEKN